MRAPKSTSFKIDDKVEGLSKKFDKTKNDYVHLTYKGIIVHDYEDDSYVVLTEAGKRILVELYDHETMRVIE